MVAAKEVGGDFFDFFLIDSNRLGFVIGDVSGKGIPAAIFMAISRTLIRAVGIKGVSASECLSLVNSLLCKDNVSSMFVTVFYGIMNISTGEVEYVNAGHNPPYVISGSGVKAVEMTGGMVLGVFDDISYKFKTFRLNPGERLFLYTDGVTEANDINTDLFGEQRLEDFLAQHVASSLPEIVKSAFNEVNTFASGVPQFDDVTMLTILYNG